MSRMSELSLAVTELRRCGEAIIGLSETLSGLFGGGDEPEAAATEPPSSKPKPITLEEVRAVLAEKSRDGFTANVRTLLEKHGAGKLSEINPSKYPTLLAEAEAIGHE